MLMIMLSNVDDYAPFYVNCYLCGTFVVAAIRRF
jgi:hypothetical protein